VNSRTLFLLLLTPVLGCQPPTQSPPAGPATPVLPQGQKATSRDAGGGLPAFDSLYGCEVRHDQDDSPFKVGEKVQLRRDPRRESRDDVTVTVLDPMDGRFAKVLLTVKAEDKDNRPGTDSELEGYVRSELLYRRPVRTIQYWDKTTGKPITEGEYTAALERYEKERIGFRK
jgi:hypothetical protein